MEPKLCKHCHAHPAGRPRGLCWTCYYNPDVRREYPSRNRWLTARGGIDDDKTRPLPAEPTPFAPGSPAKCQVLRDRARAGVQLFHPLDAPLTNPDDEPPVDEKGRKKQHGRHARIARDYAWRGRPVFVSAGDFEDEMTRRIDRAIDG